MTTEELIKEAEEKCSKATEGPWTYEYNPDSWEGSSVCGPINRKPGRHETPIICDTQYEPDGSFIAWARQGVPALVEALKSDRAKLTKAVEALNEVQRAMIDWTVRGVPSDRQFARLGGIARAALKAIGEKP